LRSRATPTRRSLVRALARPGVQFIMEVKKASPSGGTLAQAVEPAARAYAEAGAAAVSVLTDAPFFGGTLADLCAVRRHFQGPLLAKDFIVDPRQVPEARIHGADAVLVLLSLLDNGAAAAVIGEAARLGMDVLVEAHDAKEVRRAVALGAPIVGINNRDLRSLEVDVATTERLAPLVPRDRLLVSESGIHARSDVERLAPHADAFLVGTALMRATRPVQAARALAFGRVKVCGVTNPHDARAAASHGACFAGIVMVPGTPRAVSGAEAEPIVAAARRQGAGVVGVFRNEGAEVVARVAARLGLDAVQLHGEEDARYIAELREMLSDEVEIWSVGAVGRDVPPPKPGADRTLFDTEIGGSSGGTGRTFDWSRIRGRRDLATALLAGGLAPGNARAAAEVGAWALDVGSGVEGAPGRKDACKLKAFFEALRPPARSEAPSC
jgi:indole-3-glycerol phosphate synthase/phosphoribosylanthranilate isomerase